MSIGLVIIGWMILLGCNAIIFTLVYLKNTIFLVMIPTKNGNISKGFIFNALFSNQNI
jgi:hypothetical protein